ncbi:tetratricopeptide repeat protein [Massilia sp. Mn16-1_5]|uniref:tetratricopeptide repeat protein n=1 Tax=Massilia sp. Mn16-1_5 TaxID=2079199 RepID=UPI00109ED6BC|nr:SEL1-like repeat protein [Massilia sp. Mn16-1_5]THC44619.1 hypothetical protein C2862_09115 [Massilia sp. Mn16-1_5]
MKRLLCALVFGVSGLASAGELEDANKLLAAKAYTQAFPIYAKLAAAGNTEAQFRLGEMYWYGDGTAVDIPKATEWMHKAAARGHAGAVESVAILKQRETHAADIAYWTTTYQGEDLVSGQYKCEAPVLPEVSKTNAEIKAATASYINWQNCYNGLVNNLNATPPLKRIPASVLNLMTPREAEQALARVSMAYEKVGTQAQQDATRYVTQYQTWEKSTERYVATENEARKLEYEQLKLRTQQRQGEIARAQPRPEPLPTGKLQ